MPPEDEDTPDVDAFDDHQPVADTSFAAFLIEPEPGE